MLILFDGNSPRQKFIRLGVVGNNKTDDLVFRVKAQQGTVDLLNFKPWLKITNQDLTFIEKTDEMQSTPVGDYIELRFIIPSKVTAQANVDMQLSFEKYALGALVWQSVIFNVQFDGTIDFDVLVEKNYPKVLQELDERVTTLEQTQPEVTQYPSRANFPNVGKVNAVYIDIADNKSYRYDPDKNNYYVVGSDYEQIKVINCQGG